MKKSKKPTRRSLREKTDISGKKEDLERKQDVEAARRGMPKGVNMRVPYGNG